jgi:hypothetical protein
MFALATAFPSLDVPSFYGLGAMDPDVVALLAARSGGGFEIDGDKMSLHVASTRIAEPAVRALLPAGEDRIRLA